MAVERSAEVKGARTEAERAKVRDCEGEEGEGLTSLWRFTVDELGEDEGFLAAMISRLNL